MPRCYLGLGGNIGDVERTLSEAYRRLDCEAIRLCAASSCYVTPAVGKDAGHAFRNSAVAIETDLTPVDLLDHLNEIEADLGRERVVHWGPRTLDIDILFYGDVVHRDDRLSVPHPACWYRRFVLEPLAEIAANAVHPTKQMTVEELLDRISVRPMQVAVAGEAASEVHALIQELADRFDSAVHLSEWKSPENSAETKRRSEPALLLWVGSETQQFRELPAGPLLALRDDRREPCDAATYVIESALG